MELRLSSIRGSSEAFIVAFKFEGTQNVSITRRRRLGTVETDVSAEYTTDLGVDLRDSPRTTITCDGSRVVCTWVVPLPSARTPAIRTDSIVVSQDRAAFVGSKVEARLRDAAVQELTPAATATVASPDFWSVFRSPVREGLESYAADHLVPEGEELVVRVLFSDEVGEFEPLTDDWAPGLVTE